MTLLLSSLMLLVIFVGIAIVEHRGAKRNKDFFKRSDAIVADLASRVDNKYRQKYGKDPTREMPIYKKG